MSLKYKIKFIMDNLKFVCMNENKVALTIFVSIKSFYFTTDVCQLRIIQIDS